MIPIITVDILTSSHPTATHRTTLQHVAVSLIAIYLPYIKFFKDAPTPHPPPLPRHETVGPDGVPEDEGPNENSIVLLPGIRSHTD
jgi:hypothetical protein